MAKWTTSSKKPRKRDVLMHAALIAAALAVVIAATALIERASSKTPVEDNRSDSGVSGTVDTDGRQGDGDDELSDGEDGADNLRGENDFNLSELISSKYNNNIKNIVLIGVDKQELVQKDTFRMSGQADVVMILSMNLKTKEYFILSINRDLVVPVQKYTTAGASLGIVDDQIALSYAYGNGGRVSGYNVIKSLRWLLGNDMQFLGFIAAPIPIVDTLVDAVDGVEVTVLDDFEGIDDTLIQGETVVLRGEHAENYIRARKTMKESNTNAMRMNRQIQFMEAFMTKAKATMTANQLVELYSDILGMVMTDMGRSDITSWILTCYDYEFKGVYRIDGVEGEWLHSARATYYDAEEVAALVEELYYIQE